MKAPMFRIVLIALALAGLAGCKPEPPPTDEPPEPKAVAADNTELRDAIRKPIDQAKAVEGTVQDAEDKRNAEIDDAAN
ncbi:MAG: hypothetical protein ABWY34_05160 [Pseudoxanthomonas sp.]